MRLEGQPCSAPSFPTPKGNVLILAFGPPEETFTLAQLRYMWATGSMQTFLLALGGALAGLQFLWARFRRWQRQQLALGLAPLGLGSPDPGDLAAAAAAALECGATPPPPLDTATPPPPVLKVPAPGGGEGLDPHCPPGVPPWVPATLGIEGDTLQMFTSALLFSAVASFIGAWSVLFRWVRGEAGRGGAGGWCTAARAMAPAALRMYSCGVGPPCRARTPTLTLPLPLPLPLPAAAQQKPDVCRQRGACLAG